MNSISKKERFSVDVTFSDVTPESAENGDFSETGFLLEDQRSSVLDVISMVEDQGCEHSQNNGTSLTIYGDFYTEDLYSGTERQECIHVNGSEKEIALLEGILKNRGLI